MRLSGFDLNTLVVLDALLTESSVTGAADRIGLSQSATSHALGRLRTVFDDPILLRTSRGMVATAKAESLAEPVRELLRLAEEVFLGQYDFEAASSQQVFRLGMEDVAQKTVLPPLVSRIQAEAPDVSLRVERVQPQSMVRSFEVGEVDVAVSPFLPAGVRHLESELLYSAGYVTIMRAKHPQASEELTVERFLELDHVIVEHPNLADQRIDDTLAARGAARRVVVTVPSLATIPQLVRNTDLVATVPGVMLDLSGTGARLIRHTPPIRLDPAPVYLVSHVRTSASAAHRWLREQIREVFTAMPAS